MREERERQRRGWIGERGSDSQWSWLGDSAFASSSNSPRTVMEDIASSTSDSAVPHVFTASHRNETHEGAVDCDLIEQSKENVQPLRRGRDPHQLIKVLGHVAAAPSTASCAATAAPSVAAGCAVSRSEAVLKAERKVLEGGIKSYAGDAPLAPWLAYLSWTRQNFLSASLSSHLVPLLEKCTRTFLRDERVNQSLGYLEVWFQYMDHVEDSLDMFSFLYTNKIGLKHAQLYEGWALVLERRGRTQQALETLSLGLDTHSAQPAWRIKDAIKRMQARIAKSIAAAVAADPTAFNAAGGAGATGAGGAGGHEARVSALAQRMADENGSVVRQPLQRLGAPAAPTRAVNGQTTYAPPPGTVTGIVAPRPAPASANSFAAARRANVAASSSSSTTTSASNFQVFCDDDAAVAAAAAAPVASIAPVWNQYASASSLGKENRDKVGSWAEPLQSVATAAHAQGLLAEGSVVTLPAPRPTAFDFPVFVDADCALKQERDQAAAGLADAAAQAASNPRKRLDAPLRATTDKAGHVSLAKLASQPLRNMTKPSSSSSSTTAAAAPAAPSSSSSATSSSRSISAAQ